MQDFLKPSLTYMHGVTRTEIILMKNGCHLWQLNLWERRVDNKKLKLFTKSNRFEKFLILLGLLDFPSIALRNGMLAD